MQQISDAYRDEVLELIEELTSVLLELEEEPDNLDLVGAAFRALHTIKGGAGMFGFEEIMSFTHDIETVFDLVRNSKLSITKELIDQALSAVDVIKELVSGNATEISELKKTLAGTFKALCSETEEPAAAPQPAQKAAAPLSVYRIIFKPSPKAFTSVNDPLQLLNELRALGECTTVTAPENISSVQEMRSDCCDMGWEVLLSTDKSENDIRDIFIFVEGECTLDIALVEHVDSNYADRETEKLGTILTERGAVTPEQVKDALGQQKRIGEVLIEAGAVDEQQLKAALKEQQHRRQSREKAATAESAASLRVPAERIDDLVDLVAEMVTVQAQLSQIASLRNDPDINRISEEVERLTARLRDNTMSIRMLPISTTFNKFRRVVRDLSRELGKQAELVTKGGETELDKTVIDQLGDPLMHLIRNSVDHGIALPHEREAAGKPAQGTVTLTASHAGAHVLITIVDDGNGLDRDAIRSKAVEKGLISVDAELSDQELFMQIFAAGFSTATQVTNVSGRGVGMDVVKRNIEALRGSIEIESQKGEGTKITLKLPLTLAIIDGLLVQTGQDYFVLPLSAVEECIELNTNDITESHGNQVANVRGSMVPYVPLRERFNMGGTAPEVQRIVLCNVNDTQVGFVVDRVLGGHQTVIKPLGDAYRDIQTLSGATVLGDGTVALIVDPAKLAENRRARGHPWQSTQEYGVKNNFSETTLH
ncbi:MAG: chemotaxis protein CheA [Deltaproteobacteria bacterium]|nr:chemotaxis protein CheA [Deltaproteobacteria bacterium]